ncbi:MAG: TraB/GumN family protein [Desulfobacteraceae bacterium]
MIWKVKKEDKRSYLVGTAHFFPYSFRTSLSKYLKDATVVLFEGPLDEQNMAKVVNAGTNNENEAHLFEQLDRETIDRISEALVPVCRGKSSFLFFNPRTLREENPVYEMIKGMKPWLAFFTIWSNYLERNGWRHSVDYEAYTLAQEMDKEVVFLETIEEQIKVLESLSVERIRYFLESVDQWKEYAREYVKSYLDGDLENLKSMWSRFPTRHSAVIGDRDEVLYKRMLAYLEKGDAVAFVGAPHLRGIGQLLRADGYEAQKKVQPAPSRVSTGVFNF